MKHLILGAFLAAASLPAIANAATVVVYNSVEPGPAAVIDGGPATPYAEMVHNNGAPDAKSLSLTTKPGANNVVVSSTEKLSASGQGDGFATISSANGAGFSNITINPTSPFDFFNAMQFTLTPLGPSGKPLEFNFDVKVMTLSGIENIYNVAFQTQVDKFDVVGSIILDATHLIDSITLYGLQGRVAASGKDPAGEYSAYNFASIKQISFSPQAVSTPPVQTAIPEPGTWLTMIFGFGAIATGLRRRRKGFAGHRGLQAA